MTSIENTTNSVAAPQSALEEGGVNVYCVEVTPDNTEKLRALLDRLRSGVIPTADTLAQAGMSGLELTAGPDTTVAEICGVVDQQRRQGGAKKAAATTAAASAAATQVDDLSLTFFAVSHATATAAKGDDDDSSGEDPLVALPGELSLEEALKCPQIFAVRPADATAAAPTLLLFYAVGARWGAHCCCCGGLVAAILAIFCGCCGTRRTRSRQRSPKHSRTNSGNPLNGGGDANYYPNNQGAPSYPADNNTYYTQYGNYNNNNNNANYAGVPQAQMYYPPPPVSSGSSNDGGAYYKPV